MQKQIKQAIRGMQRDLSISKSSNEFSYENFNIRITANTGDSLLSITNEKGTKEVLLSTLIDGDMLGYCVLNQYVTVFTKSNNIDKIIRIDFTTLSIVELFRGSLNFSIAHPIEALGIYENANIQKVYWVDGINQPRFINITLENKVYSSDSFDFITTLDGQEQITVKRHSDSGGSFPSGVIQYALSYYNVYGQQSNIFYISDLLYTSFNTRAGSPEEKVSNSFILDILASSAKFDYIRIYSILRTSIDAVPTVKVVSDISITDGNRTTYIDTGTTGYTIDPTELLYIGGEPIFAKTLTQKDNTLFLGNITLQKIAIPDNIKQSYEGKTISEFRKNVKTSLPNGYYSYFNKLKLSSSQIKHFKYLEYYRLGVQFLHKTGKWSEAIFIGDKRVTLHVQNEFTKYADTKVPNFRITLNSSDLSKIKALGFIGARPIVVYPELSDREIVAQGILCPTVFNVRDRDTNSPFVQSSWFTRPLAPFDYKLSGMEESYSGRDMVDINSPTSISLNSKGGIYSMEDFSYITGSNVRHIIEGVKTGAWAEFRHNKQVPGSGKRNSEIQQGWSIAIPNSDSDFTRTWPENFFVDQSVVTFHSPDIELSDELDSMDSSDIKLRIVGMVPLTSSYSDLNITTSTPPRGVMYPSKKQGFSGFYLPSIKNENISRQGWKTIIAGNFWFDGFSGTTQPAYNYAAYQVCPWHRNGSLNNAGVATATEENPVSVRPSMLDKKKLSVNRYSYNSMYLQYGITWETESVGDDTRTGISGVVLFNSNEGDIIKIPAPKNSTLSSLLYKGNVDKIITSSDANNFIYGYVIPEAYSEDIDSNFSEEPIAITSGISSDYKVSDPISMKYKSTKHAVIAFNYTTDGKQVVLPTVFDAVVIPPNTNQQSIEVNSAGTTFSIQNKLFWDKDCKGIFQPVIPTNIVTANLVNIGYPYLWLGELYRDNISNRFGGSSQEAINNNIWHPCGKTTIFGNSSSVLLDYEEGDTYYSRYDCLKTYPYTQEDQNSIVDIVSFMCESRVNTDARYDKNRGNLSNLTANPTNFNLMNPVYNQKNNFFVYRGLDSKRFSLDTFANSITWSKEKQSSSLIDSWANITMANVLDLDGDKGSISSLINFNNEIYCFQDRGLSNILFNSRVQIPTSDGVPIEISNGSKVQGKRYISNHIGCSNKWSIKDTPNGIYFIDPYTNGIYIYNGKIHSLSDTLGFRNWIGENNSVEAWDSVNYNNFRTFYDSNNGDVYFTNKDTSLCYSELLGQFTSFMSYNKVPAMFNVDNKFYSINKNRLWEHEAGDYNNFYGEFKPYSMVFRVNPSTLNSVTFNSIEYRATLIDKCNNVVNSTFDTLEAWNEYQKGTLKLNNLIGRPSTLKHRLRVWKALIPRDKYANKRDRMNNPWIYLKLTKNNYSTDRLEFHDITVDYFE